MHLARPAPPAKFRSLRRVVPVALSVALVFGLGACSTAGSALDKTVLRIGSFTYSRGELEKAVKASLGKDEAAKSNGTYDAAVVARVLNAVVDKKLAPLAPADTASEVIDRKLRAEYNVEIGALFAKALAARKLTAAPLTPAIQQESQANVDPAQWAKLSKTEQDGVVLVNRQIRGLIDGAAKLEGTPEAYFKDHAGEFAQVCASHFLVKTKEEADTARARVVAGEPFAKVAKEVSTDAGSGARGGDLGCADPAGYVPEFAAAAKTLPLNEMSQPVKTQFGFHVIIVRERKSPAFDSVKPQIEQTLQKLAGEKLQKELGPEIEKIDTRFGARQQAAQADAPKVQAAIDKGRLGVVNQRLSEVDLDPRYGKIGPDGLITAPGAAANTPSTEPLPSVPVPTAPQ